MIRVKKKIKVPEISMDQALLSAKILVLACIGKGADRLVLDQDGFQDPDGNRLGDYKITVERKK